MEKEFDKVAVEKFVLACNDMLSGKFLDITKKIESVMDSITRSEDILSFLAEAIDGYDEETGFAAAFSVDKKTKKANVAIPNNDKERVALTVTIFNDIENKKININQFLETYFNDNKLTPTQNFLDKIIRPFRDIICKTFEVSENVTLQDIKEHQLEKKKQKMEEEKKAEEEQYPKLDELLKEISRYCREIQARLKFEKKKTENLDDLDFVLNATLKACEKRDLMVINGLIIGLNYVSAKFKHVRYLIRELNDLIYDYYDFLSGNSKTENMESEESQEEEFDEE